MLRAQQFKTLDGAQKRARFENAHCEGRYHFDPVRCVNGERDAQPLIPAQWSSYTWRLDRIARPK